MHDLNFVIEFLASVPPFSSLGKDHLRPLAASLEATYYPQGETILDSAEDAGLAIIRKGAVRLLDQEHRFLDKRSEGELFGHRIYFHGRQEQYLAEAEEDSLVWHLPPSAFQQACEQHSALAGYFNSHVSKRVSAAIQPSGSGGKLSELLKRPVVQISAQSSIRQAAELMSRENVSSVLVMRGTELAGIVTDKDLRQRVLAAGVDPAGAIETVMTPNPRSLNADAEVDEALLMMLSHNCRHLPVVEQGVPLGLLTAGDLLRTQSEHPLRLVSDIYKSADAGELAALGQRLHPLFTRMVRLGGTVDRIGHMITHITDAFTIKLLRLAEAELGQPPMAYAWIAFGSQAREEQTARTDQDNGLVLQRRPDDTEASYFSKLGSMVCDGLDQIGYVYCPGEIMALNVKWRLSVKDWKRQFDRWIDEPEPKSVMHCSIFFDMRCVSGEAALVREVCQHAFQRAQENDIFQRFMAANALGHRPPIGFFRRFVQEQDGSHTEGLNLKHRGIVPIIDLVRMRALEAGVSAANTFQRLDQVVASGQMAESDANSLRDALSLINQIRLNHQARQIAQGQTPTNIVPTDELSPLRRRNLKAAFMLVIEAQNALALRHQVH